MKQSIYLMWNPWLPFRVKIGISNKVERRERETGAIALFHFRLPYASWIEHGLHGFYRPLHWPASKRYSGWSEYFLCLNPMAVCALYLYDSGLPYEWYAVLLVLPVPIDAAIILYGIAAVAYGTITLFVIGFAYLLFMSF